MYSLSCRCRNLTIFMYFCAPKPNMSFLGREAEEENHRRIELAGTVCRVPGKHHRLFSRPLRERCADNALASFPWQSLSLADFSACHRTVVRILFFRGGCQRATAPDASFVGGIHGRTGYAYGKGRSYTYSFPSRSSSCDSC